MPTAPHSGAVGAADGGGSDTLSRFRNEPAAQQSYHSSRLLSAGETRRFVSQIAQRDGVQQYLVGDGGHVRAQHGQRDGHGDVPGDQRREDDAGVLDVKGHLAPAVAALGVVVLQQLVAHHRAGGLVAEHHAAHHGDRRAGGEPPGSPGQALGQMRRAVQHAHAAQQPGVQPGADGHDGGRDHGHHAAAGEHVVQRAGGGEVAQHRIPQGGQQSATLGEHRHQQRRQRTDGHGGPDGDLAQRQDRGSAAPGWPSTS